MPHLSAKETTSTTWTSSGGLTNLLSITVSNIVELCTETALHHTFVFEKLRWYQLQHNTTKFCTSLCCAHTVAFSLLGTQYCVVRGTPTLGTGQRFVKFTCHAPKSSAVCLFVVVA